MEEGNGSPPLAWRRRLAMMLMLLLAVSIGARMTFGKETTNASDPASPSGNTPPSALMPTQVTPETQAEEPKEPSGMQKLLPFVTEGAVAMLIGLAAGIATRMLAKMVILAILLFFLGTQFLAYKGFVDVDYGAFMHWIKDFVLNISASADFQSIISNKLPSAGAFLIGYFLGLKRA